MAYLHCLLKYEYMARWKNHFIYFNSWIKSLSPLSYLPMVIIGGNILADSNIVCEIFIAHDF